MPDCKWKLLFSVIILLSFASTVAGAERACVLIAEDILSGPANSQHSAARVRVRDSVTSDTIAELKLPNGSTGVRTVRISPDARWAAVSHTIGNFHKPTRRPISTWINANALSIIDMSRLEIFGSVLLDDPWRGAANPWGLAFSADSKTLVVTHAGTHEVSIIDFPDLVQRLSDLPAPVDPVTAKQSGLSQQDIDAVNYVRFFPARRQRIQLAKTDRGPRSVSIIGHTAYVTNYFSDTVSVIDFSVTPARVQSVPLGNVLAPGKRPRVTLTPTLATKDGAPWLAFAIQGGDGQDQHLLQYFLNIVEFGMTPQEAAESPAFVSQQMRESFEQHASKPGTIWLNDVTPPYVRSELLRMGYKPNYGARTMGPVNAIMIDPKYRTFWGASSNHGEDHGIGW